jgi:2-polyprenyl-6-hydroxyphenyl methylase/3-demethylubiquinone-9 3-methyltransferase
MEKLSGPETMINNDFYEELGEDWYTATDHPIALLRAENKARIPYIVKYITSHFKNKKVDFLDVGCGGGLLSNPLSQLGNRVTGIDLSLNSLEIAKKHDSTGSVRYIHANALELPFPENHFDVVCAMDILEHVEEPNRLVAEAQRVLRPQGLFFFHTFNRNLLSYLLIIKGVDWFVPNVPKNMHILRLFITPKEMRAMCQKNCLKIEVMDGFGPNLFSSAIWKLVLFQQIPKNFSFVFTKNLLTGYCGYAIKN